MKTAQSPRAAVTLKQDEDMQEGVRKCKKRKEKKRKGKKAMGEAEPTGLLWTSVSALKAIYKVPG